MYPDLDITYLRKETESSLRNVVLNNKKFWEELIAYFSWYETGHIENEASNNSSIVACVFVTAVTFLPSRCLATIGGLQRDKHTDSNVIS
jgi:hypothetical protein